MSTPRSAPTEGASRPKIDALLEAEVRGHQLHGPHLKDQIPAAGALLVFLRHFGCTFCRAMVADLQIAAREPGYPHVILVHQGTLEEDRAFFESRWADVSTIADPERRLYAGFGVQRGTALQLFGPQTLLCGLRGLAKGYGVGRLMGDPMMMPALFFVKDGEIRWSHPFRHAGDRPDFMRLPAILSEVGVLA